METHHRNTLCVISHRDGDQTGQASRISCETHTFGAILRGMRLRFHLCINPFSKICTGLQVVIPKFILFPNAL